jgi:hypothetical protein
MSERGERGPTGDHGQTGETGDTGATGKTGAVGRSSALSRHVTASFVAIVVISFVVLAVMGWQITQNRERAKEGQQAHDAICALKGNLADRILASQTFLEERPNGIPGLTPTLIQDSIDRDKLALDAMSPVRCTAAERQPTTTGKAQP